jgi:hypothetical protein
MLIPAEICESSCGQIVDHYSVQNMYYDVVNGFISLSLLMLCFFLNGCSSPVSSFHVAASHSTTRNLKFSRNGIKVNN